MDVPFPMRGAFSAGPWLPGAGAGLSEPARHGMPSPLIAVEDCHVDVFDMSSKEDRSRYEGLMSKLAPAVQTAACVLCRNELQVLSGPSGSGWWRYVEWFDCKVADRSDEKGTPETRGQA